MTPAHVLVLGAGSIGRRHAANLVAEGAQVAIADPSPAAANAVPEATAVPYDLGRLVGYDGIVVASPTAVHAEQVLAALDVCDHVFVEKPLAADLASAERTASAGSGRVMVGFNLRLHEPIVRLRRVVEERVGRLLALRLWFGSHLPDWRPGTDYRQSYSARAELGGGVLLDAIHELDLACWLTGKELRVVGAVVERLGDLDIDVEDTVKAVLMGAGGPPVEISLDYLSRRYRRGIEVIGAEVTVRLDWAREVLEIEDADGVQAEYMAATVDRSYLLQTRRFLDWITTDRPPPVDAAEALRAQRLAEEIRAAASVLPR